MLSTNKTKLGFTLIELLVVVAIVGLISSVVFASLRSAREKARDAKRLQDMKQISLALELYYNTNRTYPIIMAYVNPASDNNWSTTFATMLSPYLSPLPQESTLSNGYLYSSTDSGQKYGLAASFESSSNSGLMTGDGGYYNNYYEVGQSPSACAAVGKDWWGSTSINCP